MRILYVDLTTGTGGAIISLAQLLSRLDRTAFQPMVLLASNSQGCGRLSDLDIPLITVPVATTNAPANTALVAAIKGRLSTRRLLQTGWLSRLWTWARSVRDFVVHEAPLTYRLYRIFRSAEPDLVHINVISSAAMAAAWLARRPAICHMRWQGPLTRWERLWSATVRRFVFISRWIAEYDTRQGIPRDRGRLIYNGMDLAPYAQLPTREMARGRFGLPADRRVVTVMGRLVPWKGQDLFLRAMRHVVDAVPEALGLVVGEAEDFSRNYAEQLPVLAAELGLADAIRFTGYIGDVPTVMAATDVLAHTSVEPEPFGRVLIEAMAAGRPVISPAEGGGVEIVEDGWTGLLIAPRDEVALANAIIKLLADSELVAAMGAAGRRRVAELFSLDQHVKAITDLYREVVANP